MSDNAFPLEGVPHHEWLEVEARAVELGDLIVPADVLANPYKQLIGST